MKKPLLITGGILAAFLLLFLFNKLTSRRPGEELFAEAVKGSFEITVSASGELMAEHSIDILGPDIMTGRDIRSSQIEIQDLIPEGTIVRKGDYIGSLNRTELSNQLMDAQERLVQLKSNLEVKLLDTAVQLNGLRDQIKNQEFSVQEREMTLKNSKFEPPTVIRQAEINVEQANRVLDQVRRNYTRRHAQLKTDIYNQNFWIRMIEKRVRDMEEVLAGFTITAPSDGMLMYKRDFRGNKRKAGSRIDPRDRVIATLPDLSSMISKVFVGETEVSRLKNGQQVEVSVDAFPDKRYTGIVNYVANIGEKLPNTNDKMFEVHVKLTDIDPNLRPSMTTTNKVIIRKYDDAVFVPIDAIQATADSVPFVFKKNGVRQVVVTGEANDKNMIVEQGLEAGTMVYVVNPENPDKFRLDGEDLIRVIKERDRMRRMANAAPSITAKELSDL